MRRFVTSIAVVVIAVGIAAGAGAGRPGARDGGIFHISLVMGSGSDSLDPALEYTGAGVDAPRHDLRTTHDLPGQVRT